MEALSNGFIGISLKKKFYLSVVNKLIKHGV